MTYDAREISNYDGAPISLYDFYRDSTHWRYCSADRDVTVGGFTWTAIPIRDNGVVQDSERASSVFEVTLPASAAVPQLYRVAPPSSRVWLAVSRTHDGETEFVTTFAGVISQCSVKDEGVATLACQSLLVLLSSTGNRLSWQRACPHMLYDGECKVNKASYAVSGTIASISGNSITVAAAAGSPAGDFNGGIIAFVRNGFTEYRTIQSHSGSGLNIFGNTAGMTNGMAVTLYPGCNRTAERCNDRFSNIDNYGGVRHLPGKSPFTGEIVF